MNHFNQEQKRTMRDGRVGQYFPGGNSSSREPARWRIASAASSQSGIGNWSCGRSISGAADETASGGTLLTQQQHLESSQPWDGEC